MTTVTVTTEIPPRDKMEDNSALYESTSAHIIEETEYVKKIRTTLQKIRTQMFKDEIRHNSTNHKLDAKHCGNLQQGSDSEMDPSCCSLDLLMKKIKGKDLQLLEMNKENEVLKIKLEASREAGAAALRNVAQRLFENYQTQSEEVRKKQEDSKQLLQVNKLEKEQKLKQHVENLNQVAEKLEEKHSQITELENLVQRMEKSFREAESPVKGRGACPRIRFNGSDPGRTFLGSDGLSPALIITRNSGLSPGDLGQRKQTGCTWLSKAMQQPSRIVQ
ncbi:coiled-coil domain-containing protein 68 isoform X3 [Pan troglodytes]|uniref:coiled-coil domain-containing protein 68 isoform X3 n=1 Tax=Pan troglodytes TaxID=9598 RepID=UPI0007DBD4FB|nr:coiled-coil domain-containing protein 68 isoform X3 [Pan troglodytes]